MYLLVWIVVFFYELVMFMLRFDIIGMVVLVKWCEVMEILFRDYNVNIYRIGCK